MASKLVASVTIVVIAIGVVVSGAVAIFFLLAGREAPSVSSRIYLRLEASRVVLNFSKSPSDNDIKDLIDRLEESLYTSITPLMSYEDVRAHNQIVLEIGKIVTENMISPLIGEDVKIQPPIKNEVSFHTREKVIDALHMRVDPYGTLGVQIRSISHNFVLVEAPIPLERLKRLLMHQGRLEIFIENKMVLWGEHLKDVSSPRYSRERMRYEVPFELTDEGAKRFANASENKGGYPGVIYLDRPEDSILLFKKGFKGQVSADAEPDPSIGAARYDENARRFRFRTLGDGEAHWFYLQINAVEIQRDNIPDETLTYLRAQRGMKRKVIFLGDLDDFSENMIRGGNLVWDNEVLFPIEGEPRLEGEFATEWLARAVGAESWPIISEEIAGNENRIKAGLVITTGSEEYAEDLYKILSQRLPVKISIESEAEVEF